MKREIFERLQAARAAKRPVALASELDSGRQALLDGETFSGDLPLGAEDQAAVRTALTDDRSGVVADGRIFVHVFNPPLRLLVIGAVHIAQSLVPMARLAGYDVTLIDPRRAWANASRFPDVALVDAWPDEALAALRPDRRSAVVTLTHDPKLDDPALIAALASEAFYVGALGSTRTHGKRLERLRAAGLDDTVTARLHAPIGLPIGARSPAEIAIAILAEITSVLHGGRASGRRDAAA